MSLGGSGQCLRIARRALRQFQCEIEQLQFFGCREPLSLVTWRQFNQIAEYLFTGNPRISLLHATKRPEIGALSVRYEAEALIGLLDSACLQKNTLTQTIDGAIGSPMAAKRFG